MEANINDGDGARRLVNPPDGFGFRRIRRRTCYYRRAIVGMTNMNARHADFLFQLSTLWLSAATQHLAAAIFAVTSMLGVGSENEQDEIKFIQYLRTATSSLSVACQCHQIAANLWVNVRNITMFRIDELYVENFLSIRPVRYRTIASLDDSSAVYLTGFHVGQLQKMLLHLRFPEFMFPPTRRCRYTGEEVLLTFLYWLRKGSTFIDMAALVFGGDARDFSHMMRLAVNHLYSTFYHKISGRSLSMWIDYLNDFRLAIFNRLTNNPRWWEMVVHPEMHELMDITFESFRIFGFMDDVDMATCRPGDFADRFEHFFHDIQRAFYSGYFKDHGLKAQVVYLPNGMIGSVFVTSMAHNDVGIMNMSGIDDYLQELLINHMIGPHFPALYVDGIYPVKNTIIPRFKGILSEAKEMFNKRMAGVRVSVEHAFGLHGSLFDLVHRKKLLKVFHGGNHVHNLFLVSFLIQNCYQCFNHSLNMFDLPPPSIEEYLPLFENLDPAPFVPDHDIGTVYQFDATVPHNY